MSDAKITLAEVEHVARLARLALADDEKDRMRSQLDKILGYVEQLRRIDTTGVEPTAHVLPLAPRPDAASRWQPEAAYFQSGLRVHQFSERLAYLDIAVLRGSAVSPINLPSWTRLSGPQRAATRPVRRRGGGSSPPR